MIADPRAVTQVITEAAHPSRVHPRTLAARNQLGTEFEHRGHSLTIDGGWKDVAEAVLQWLRAQGA